MNHHTLFWHKVTLRVPISYESSASTLLLKLAPQGIWLEDEGKTEVQINAFLPASISQNTIREVLKKALDLLIAGQPYQIIVEKVAEEVWQTAWQRHSIPIQNIGRTLQIVPPWEMKTLGKSERHVICLSPGMAFGTGTHATTHTCLLFLEDFILNGFSGPLLDVGTGSGILAIAAAKLGIKQITATEIDLVALEVAKKNARANQVLSKINFQTSIPSGKQYACILANLTTSVLLALQTSLTEAVLPGGTLILSGMLKEGHEAVLDRYRPLCTLIRLQEKEDWITILMKI